GLPEPCAGRGRLAPTMCAFFVGRCLAPGRRWREMARTSDLHGLSATAISDRPTNHGGLMKRIVSYVTMAALSVALSVALAEDKTRDATLRRGGGSVAGGIGISWGSGPLTLKGKDYPIDVKGLSVGDVGVTKLEASGKVYNLKSTADFDGNF